MTLGERIRRLRAHKGWSQRELARRAGVRYALLSELETGKKGDTTFHNIQQIARALGITTNDLAGKAPGTSVPDPKRWPGAGLTFMSLSVPLLGLMPARRTPSGGV
jgi:transcriptional regulator with XRE-family HTH domain